MRKILASLLFIILLHTSFAQPVIEQQVKSQITQAQSFLAIIIGTVLIVAIIGYMATRTLGAEYRAKGTAWLTSVLTAIIASAVIAILGPVFITSFIGGAKEWQRLSAYAAILSVTLSAIAIVLSRAFDLKNIEQAAKTELVYAASTVFLVMVLVIITEQGSQFAAQIAKDIFRNTFGLYPPGTAITHIDVMKLYMKPAQVCINKMVTELYTLSVPIEGITTVYMEIFMSEHASGFGFKTISERIMNTATLLQFYGFFYYLIMHVVDFIDIYAEPFLAIGVILRAFPMTRGAGAYVLALALGLYFVFPLTYVIGSSLAIPALSPEFIQYQRGGSLPAGQSGFTCMVPDFDEFSSCSNLDAAEAMRAVGYFEVRSNQINYFLNKISPEILRQITISVCLFPLTALIVVFTFVLSTTNLLGGNVPEIGRGLIKLI